MLNYCPKGVNHSQNNATVIFLTFGISPQFFVNGLKFNHKVKPSNNADRNAIALILIKLFLFRPVLFAQKNCKVAAGCRSYD